MPLSLKDKRPTEHRNPASRNLDRMSTMAILRLMNREDRKVAAAVKREIRAIARATESIVRSIRRGGRVFYVGAGTSGRLAALDAAECPPTFGVSPRMVQALIAGGRRALTHAVEGAEDSSANGARELKQKNLSSRDVVVGISASGLTPYVIGALVYARKRGCDTIAVTSNRDSALARAALIKITPRVGPELIAGSSRLKAGTSQKLVLNMLSTASMVRLGHVYENLMIDVAQTNLKLRWRAVHILSEASGNRNVSAVTRSLRQSGRNLREALIMLKKGVTPREARARLKRAGGDLRRALGE
jgi:N-acetylmuramic acid 6-phosphate etherase